MDLMTISCPWGEGARCESSSHNQEEGLRDRLGSLKSEQGRRAVEERESFTSTCYEPVRHVMGKPCGKAQLWKKENWKWCLLESRRVDGFDEPLWVVTEDCQPQGCGAAGRQYCELTPLLWPPGLMQGLSSLIFISASFLSSQSQMTFSKYRIFI